MVTAILAANFGHNNEIATREDSTTSGPIYLFRDPQPTDSSALFDGLLGFTKFFLLLSSILPISLLVSLEIIKLLQALFIGVDVQMYSLDVDQRCKVISMSLNEELGLINNIFTDKTGTLTVNEMVFKA